MRRVRAERRISLRPARGERGMRLARRKKGSSRFWPGIAAAVLLAAVFWGIRYLQVPDAVSGNSGSSPAPAAGETQVWFLDVGQGDSELIRLKTGQTVLIDAGTGETARQLSATLRELGVTRIDILIATHPHEDHIGGMAQVVRDFPVGKIYMPKIPAAQVPTTAVYENLLKAIDRKGLKITAARGGMTLLDENGIRLETFAPNSGKYGNLNNYSIAAKLTCGQKSFLFMGDAETESEKEILAKGYDVRSDVLKCGHHGSSTSTGAAFLKAVAPRAAVLSCGVNNDYGHPSKQVVDRLKKAGVTIYRTDQQDTILARCDGTTISFETKRKSVIKAA